MHYGAIEHGYHPARDIDLTAWQANTGAAGLSIFAQRRVQGNNMLYAFRQGRVERVANPLEARGDRVAQRGFAAFSSAGSPTPTAKKKSVSPSPPTVATRQTPPRRTVGSTCIRVCQGSFSGPYTQRKTT